MIMSHTKVTEFKNNINLRTEAHVQGQYLIYTYAQPYHLGSGSYGQPFPPH